MGVDPLAFILVIVVNAPVPAHNSIDWVRTRDATVCHRVAPLVENDAWRKIARGDEWKGRTVRVWCERPEEP